MVNALIVVDVQNDFCEGGSLPVRGGAAVATGLTRYIADNVYPYIVATRDYHVDPGDHFSENPDFVTTWPAHCVVGTAGASFHPDLDVSAIQAVFSKGAYAAAYSGFEGADPAGHTLASWLRDHSVDQVDIAGIATDYCVRATALDALRGGFAPTVLLDLTAGVNQSTVDTTLTELRTAGVRLVGEPKA